MKEIENRRSVRKYKPEKIEKDKLMQILESARLAPSGSNTQPWNYIIVEELGSRIKLAEAAHHQMWMAEAPVFIVCVGDINCRVSDNKGISLNEDTSLPELKLLIRDMAISIEHIVLEAEHLGLSTCWVADYYQKDIKPLLNIPEDKYVSAIIVLGYGDEKPNPRPRRALEEIVRYEKW